MGTKVKMDFGKNLTAKELAKELRTLAKRLDENYNRRGNGSIGESFEDHRTGDSWMYDNLKMRE